MPSRLITDLHPAVQAMARCAVVGWRDAGLDVLITCTFRSAEEQAELYAAGRTKRSHVGVTDKRPLGAILTRAKPGESSHNFRINGYPASLALDVVPRREGRVLVWGTKGNGLDDDPSDDHTDDLELWQRVAAVAKRCGLQWFGDPDAPFRELPHFQHPQSRDIRLGRVQP
jgi:peptidoglycan LD-endopeptidase CwlK